MASLAIQSPPACLTIMFELIEHAPSIFNWTRPGRGKRCRQGAGAVVVQELTETMGPGFEYSHLQFYENNII